MAEAKSKDSIAIFKKECAGQLETIRSGILAVSKDSRQREILERILRAVEILKGSARTMGQESIQDKATRLEDLFDEIRDGKEILTRDTVQIVLREVDLLRTALEKI